MEPFHKHTGIVAPLDRMNVDTDSIMPKEFLKRIERTGFGKYLFYHWRYEDDGRIKPNFVLNQESYKQASILLVRKNFGCGSSREHAPWGLFDYGFKVIIAPSFADIFYNNCFKTGLLPLILSESEVEKLFELVLNKDIYKLTVDLEQNKVYNNDNDISFQASFYVDSFRREQLLQGLDEIELTQIHENYIKSFESNHQVYYEL